MDISPTDLMRQRTSWRSYSTSPLEDHLIEEIQSILIEHRQGSFDTTIDWQLIDRYDGRHQREKLGTYGFVRNARHFIAGSVLPSREAFLDYGFLLESIILELTAMGLGTCWLGGTFDRGEFAKAIQLKDNHVIPAITPVGHTSKTRSIGDRIIRTTAGSRNRKTWSELFFEDVPGNPLKRDLHPRCTSMLEMVTIGSSASNLQPWRIICRGQFMDLYLERKPGYDKAFGSVDIQMLDMGIAMCHFSLAAREQEIVLRWEMLNDVNRVKGWEYIISAVL